MLLLAQASDALPDPCTTEQSFTCRPLAHIELQGHEADRDPIRRVSVNFTRRLVGDH